MILEHRRLRRRLLAATMPAPSFASRFAAL